MTYPFFRNADDALIAVTSPADVFVISPRGTNVGCEGYSIDHYRTRRMVRKYETQGHEISAVRFATVYRGLFASILDVITHKTTERNFTSKTSHK